MIIEFSYNNEKIKIAAHSSDTISDIINGVYNSKHQKTFYELELLEYIKSKFTGGVVLDIGANIGNHSLFFSKFVFNKTFAFETNPSNIILLNETKKINNISDESLVIYHVALSDGHYKYINKDFRGNMGRSFIIEGEGDLITKKLDDFDLPKVDLIKLDVEGHELNVLKGSNVLINKDFPHIVLECNDYTDDFNKVNPYMLQLNYKLIKKFEPNMFYYEHE
jgi:FkbM family methyltransferase